MENKIKNYKPDSLVETPQGTIHVENYTEGEQSRERLNAYSEALKKQS